MEVIFDSKRMYGVVKKLFSVQFPASYRVSALHDGSVSEFGVDHGGTFTF